MLSVAQRNEHYVTLR